MIAAMNEQSEPLAPGAFLRDAGHRVFVYLGECKGQPMAAPLQRRERQAFAGDVSLTEEVVARVSAIAPVTNAAPTGQALKSEQITACLHSLQRLAETERVIAKHAGLKAQRKPIVPEASVEILSGDNASLAEPASRKPERGAV